MTFLIVDDHPVLREGLAALLCQTFAPASTILACDAEAAFSVLAAHRDLDVVILDLNMPGMVGMELIAEVGRRRADLPIVVPVLIRGRAPCARNHMSSIDAGVSDRSNRRLA